MPADSGAGHRVHNEYHGAGARSSRSTAGRTTVSRQVRDGVTGPRVTKAVFAVDVGLAVNPRGLEAQMMGGIMDGIALALTSSLHLRDGYFLEASWDDYFYTRQWNAPLDVEVIVMPPTTGTPGGAGEFGVAAAASAVAAAYARATGTHADQLPDQPRRPAALRAVKPTVPPIPPPRPTACASR